MLEIVHARVCELWGKACILYPRIISYSVPLVKINKRLKTTAGYAHYDIHMVEFSEELLFEYPEHFQKDTIPHEVSHLVTRIVWPDKKGHHTRDWYEVMHRLSGLEVITRCHDLVNTKHAERVANRKK